MGPLRFVPLRLALPALVLGALVTVVGGCEKEVDPPDYTTLPPGQNPNTSGGTKPDGGTSSDGGVTQEASARPLLRLLAPASNYAVQTRSQVATNSVPSEASGLGSSGHVVTAAALGTDGLSLVGVKEFGSGRVFETNVRTGDTEAELQAAALSLAEAGYLVTAVAPGTTGYSVVGVRQVDASERVAVRVRKVSAVSEVYAAANQLGGAGFGVTALAKGPGGFVLVGTQLGGSTGAYAASTRLVLSSELQAAVTALSGDGHVITGLAYDNDYALVLGIKPAGATRTYASSVLETSVGGLYSNASSLASQGYMVTAMGFDGTNYRLVGIR